MEDLGLEGMRVQQAGEDIGLMVFGRLFFGQTDVDQE